MQNSTTVLACSFNSHENYAYWQEWRCVFWDFSACCYRVNILGYEAVTFCYHCFRAAWCQSSAKFKKSKFCESPSSITALFRARTQPLLPHFLDLAVLHSFILHLPPAASFCSAFLSLMCSIHSPVHLTIPLLLLNHYVTCLNCSFSV